MRRAARLVLVLALSLSIGLQWALVQGAAWAGMILSFSREHSLTRAIEMTFDGAHPCRLCKAVRRDESGQKRSASIQVVLKIDLAEPTQERVLFIGPAQQRPDLLVQEADPVALSPPTPPPRPV